MVSSSFCDGLFSSSFFPFGTFSETFRLESRNVETLGTIVAASFCTATIPVLPSSRVESFREKGSRRILEGEFTLRGEFLVVDRCGQSGHGDNLRLSVARLTEADGRVVVDVTWRITCAIW